jgi:hypothetical protein
MRAILIASTSVSALALSNPEQPHLAQAWTALSSGDGIAGQTGIEHYIYSRDDHTDTGMNGHIWDYGETCKKLEVDVGFDPKDPAFVSGLLYMNCDGLDCCYDADTPRGQRPDVKQWDIHAPGLLSKTKFSGYNDTTELNDNPVKQAEHWNEIDKLPFTKGSAVTYDYYITRNADGSDVTSHRIDYSAPGAAPGSILYGNFTVVHNLTALQELFKLPDVCKKNIMACNPGQVQKWERTYFKHSFATKSLAKASKQVMV